MIRTYRTFLIVLLASGLLFIAIPGWAQQPQPKTQKPPAQTVPQEQEEYTEEEYDAYEKATQEADLDKRGTMLLAFMDKFPKSKLLSYIVTAYQTVRFEHQKNQRYAKLLPLAETWLKYYPDDLQKNWDRIIDVNVRGTALHKSRTAGNDKAAQGSYH